MSARRWNRAGQRCGYCGKACYPNERAATVALRGVHHDQLATMNAYRCQSGGSSWHVGHKRREYEWPGWDDAAVEQQCQRCPAVIAVGEPVATLGSTSMCFDCGDLAEQAALSKKVAS